METSQNDIVTYARLLAGQSPNGWTEIAKEHWWTGFDAKVWRSGETGATVIGIYGLTGIVDYIGSVIRRLAGYDPRILIWAKQQKPHLIIGHSGGGGVASWAGVRLGLPTVTFASGRTRWSLENDGRQQTNIWIRGDRWGDPEAGYGMPLNGKNIILEPAPGDDRHQMPSIVQALEKAQLQTSFSRSKPAPGKAPVQPKKENA